MSEKIPLYFLIYTLPNANRFSNSFTGRLLAIISGKTIIKYSPPHLKCVATLPTEIFLLKNRRVPGWVKRIPIQDLSIQSMFWKNMHLMILAPFFTDKSIFTVVTSKNPQNNRLYYASMNQEQRRRDKTPAHQINFQSVTASVGESQFDTIRYDALYLSAPESWRVASLIYRTEPNKLKQLEMWANA